MARRERYGMQVLAPHICILEHFMNAIKGAVYI